MPKLRCVLRTGLLVAALWSSPREAGAAFIHNFDMYGDYTQYLEKTVNARVFTEGGGDTLYWSATQAGVVAEIVYRYDLGFQIGSADLYATSLAIDPERSGAQTYLDVSRDGITWVNVASGYLHPPQDPIDVSAILSGSEEAFVRSRLYVANPGWEIYAQFLRTAPYTHAPETYQFRAFEPVVAAPAPPSLLLGIVGSGCVITPYLILRRRRTPPR